MADFQTLYTDRLKTPEQVAGYVESGDVCASDIALSQSPLIVNAICKRVANGELKQITQHSLLDTANLPYFQPEIAEEYRCVSWFSQAAARKAVNKAIADVMPCYYRDIPGLMEQYIQPDVLIAVVSPMDKHGYFSLGCDGSISQALIKCAKKILLEVNPRMPRAVCGPQIHISKVTALCENDAPMLCLPKTELDEISIKIGNYIAEEIPNGATLQLGIGGVPAAVGLALKDKRNLGIHTEMFTDSLMDLIECGAVDNSCKPIHTGKTVTTFALGSQRMYDFIDDNPGIELLPVNYVNDPATIAMHPNFISVNGAVEVDFYGQICAESVGTKHVSGTGGHQDFTRGAIQSPGGKSFIAFTSTSQNDTCSRILPTLTTGAVVSTGKNDVDHIVTEYGIAKLRGRTLSQRTKALIAIAHPKFRDELLFAAKKQNIII